MQLANYEITVSDSGKKLIHFLSFSLVNLEAMLNSFITKESTINDYLDRLNYLKNNWPNLDNIVREQYHDYWDWEILEAFKVAGQWFTFGGSEFVIIFINKANQHIYIYDEILEDHPIVEMSLDEFIDILEQWRVIQTS
jgi:hypothetical protein